MSESAEGSAKKAIRRTSTKTPKDQPETTEKAAREALPKSKVAKLELPDTEKPTKLRRARKIKTEQVVPEASAPVKRATRAKKVDLPDKAIAAEAPVKRTRTRIAKAEPEENPVEKRPARRISTAKLAPEIEPEMKKAGRPLIEERAPEFSSEKTVRISRKPLRRASFQESQTTDSYIVEPLISPERSDFHSENQPQENQHRPRHYQHQENSQRAQNPNQFRRQASRHPQNQARHHEHGQAVPENRGQGGQSQQNFRGNNRPQQQPQRRDAGNPNDAKFERGPRRFERFAQKHHGTGERREFNRQSKPNHPHRQESRHFSDQHVGLTEAELLGPEIEADGLLEITPKGFGFLRTAETDFEQIRDAIFVPTEVIRGHGLRQAQWIKGTAKEGRRGSQLVNIESVNGIKPSEIKNLPAFDDLKATNPTKRIPFETAPEQYTTRVLDIVSPIARGQRGLIVSPPRTGKTTFLRHMAEAILANHAESLHLMVLLVDERPEEVTDFKRNLRGAEVYASSNDGRVKDHTRLAELCIERAKRLVEGGKHVFLLMDSITRLARAYNNADKGSGRTMSGGIDARALEMPRRLFAAARNTKEAGSLTIIATALIETNSRMDELIFQEFKGTGNMELVLNRKIAENYFFPAVDILKSGTRREELILPEIMLDKIHLIRRGLAGHKPVEALERLLFFLKKYQNNAQMLVDIKSR